MAGWEGSHGEYSPLWCTEDRGHLAWKHSCELKWTGLSFLLAQGLAWEEGGEVNGGRPAQRAKALLGLSGR